ncbi:ArnT family glycosyltransferase [Sunxiuqinia sp. A32]|uniref:ArnT family glycosyltransferase n=1 Tax=Sunxiuqinia sp. A32 TaxID=3461496 RepID=UPI004045C5FA
MNQFLQKKSSIWWLLGVNFFLRLIVLFATNLGNDEVYYTLYALFPDWSYFDHPPMVGILIRLSTFNLTLIYNDFFVRFGALILGSVNLFLVYQIGKLLKDRTTGLVAAILLSASFYSSIIVGAFVLPDTPQSTFWLLSILFFLSYLIREGKGYLLLFGLAVGFAILSKYHAIYLWAGVFVYLLMFNRKEFLNPYMWLSGVISILVFSPVIYWNLTSEYSGIAYHASRVGNDSLIPTIKYFFPEFFGQIFYNNPFNFYLIVVSLIILYRQRKALLNRNVAFLLCISLPLIITTLGMSFFNRTLPHWSGPSYFGLVLIASYVFSTTGLVFERKTLKRVMIYGHSLVVVLIVFSLIQINYGFLTGSEKVSNDRVGKGDFTVDIGFWDEIADELNQVIDREIENKNISADYVILTHKWFPASHLDYYFAMPHEKKLFVYGERNNQHLYLKINKRRGPLTVGTDVLYVTTSAYFTAPDKELENHFEKVSKPLIIPIIKNGKKRVNIFVWELKNLKEDFELTTNL